MTRFGHILFSAVVATNIAFSRPIQFSEALQSREIRSLLPTTLPSAEIRDAIEPAIIERAVLSARMTNAEVLQRIDDITVAIVNGELDLATGKLRLQQILEEIGYVPSAKDAGTVKDFLSDQRIDLIVRTNAQIAQGYGQFIQGQTEGILAAFPCQELFRLQRRKVERGSAQSRTAGWTQRWSDVGGKISEGGRMIARKDDDIWRRLGSAFPDSLGNPYPPFAFNSGMWVKDVSRSEAVKLGVIEPDAKITPQDRGFNDDLRFTADVRNAALIQALMESIGDDYQFIDGVLTYA